MTYIADTGFILSRWSKSAARRRWSRHFLDKGPLPFITAEAALMEAGYRLDVAELAPRLLRDGDYVSGLTIGEHAEDLLWLLRKYADLEMDLVDACLVKLFELYPEATILTTDRNDFSVYRTRAGHRLRCDFAPD
jgi:predicted nucleic acid-binding protein